MDYAVIAAVRVPRTCEAGPVPGHRRVQREVRGVEDVARENGGT